jgi:hypothetical protein
LKQQAVTEFLVTECEKPICIHKDMLKVHGEGTVDASTVWQWAGWINECQTQGAELHTKLQWLLMHNSNT